MCGENRRTFKFQKGRGKRSLYLLCSPVGLQTPEPSGAWGAGVRPAGCPGRAEALEGGVHKPGLHLILPCTLEQLPYLELSGSKTNKKQNQC